MFAPGVISTQEGHEIFPVIDPITNELVWYTWQGDNPRQARTVALPLDGSAQRPATPPFVAGDGMGPNFTPDGSKVYFARMRPARDETKPWSPWSQQWVAERRGDEWAAPQPLDLRVAEVAVARSGNIYATSNHGSPDGSGDLYVLRLVNGRLEEPVTLGPFVNSTNVEEHVFVDPDERFLLFSSRRPSENGEGKNDIYISVNENGQWSPARNLGPAVNTRANDAAAFVSPDGKYLFFCSDRTGQWDIYWVSVQVLGLEHEPDRNTTARTRD